MKKSATPLVQPSLWEDLPEQPDEENWLCAGDLRLIRRLRLRLRRRFGRQEPITFRTGKGLRSRVHLEESERGLLVSFPKSWDLKKRHPWHLALTGPLPKPPKRVRGKRGAGPDEPAMELRSRARELARQYLPPLPDHWFFWSPRLLRTWGLCDPEKGTIRLSDKARELPDVALDYLLLHEMIHLLVPNHGKRFQKLIRRFPGFKEARKIMRDLDLDEARRMQAPC